MLSDRPTDKDREVLEAMMFTMCTDTERLREQYGTLDDQLIQEIWLGRHASWMAHKIMTQAYD